MSLTLGQAKASSRIQRISGLCSNSDEFIGLLNDAIRMLVNRGDWYGTVKKIRACVYSGCITWPRQVATVLAINRCNSPATLANHWYTFDSLQRDDLLGYWNSGCCGQLTGVQGETSPVFNPISCASGSAGVYIRFYPTDQNDLGKLVTVFGIDSNGEELRDTHSDGIFQDGVEVPLEVPYSTMPATGRNVPTMRHITRMIKPITQGPVYAYQYDAVRDVLMDLGRYEASETHPEYQTTRLGGTCAAACSCNGSPLMISALVKLKHVDVALDNDLIVLDNLDAIAMMMQAIKLGDAYDADQKRKAEAEAVREMNLELRRQLPLEQIPVTVSPFGTALPSRHGIGRFS